MDYFGYKMKSNNELRTWVPLPEDLWRTYPSIKANMNGYDPYVLKQEEYERKRDSHIYRFQFKYVPSSNIVKVHLSHVLREKTWFHGDGGTYSTKVSLVDPNGVEMTSPNRVINAILSFPDMKDKRASMIEEGWDFLLGE